MGVEVFYTKTYTRDATFASWPSRMKDLVQLLCSKTVANIYRVNSDVPGYYDAIVHMGGNRYARFAYGVASATPSGDVCNMSVGYVSGGEYIQTQANGTSRTAGQDAYANYVAVVNGGDCIDVAFKHTQTTFWHVRATKLVSSISGQTTWAMGVDGSSKFAPPFPSCDYVLVDGVDWSIEYSNPTTSKYNVPEGKILLFPTLLCTASHKELGVPSVGGMRTYFMSGQADIPLDAYSEFMVDQTKYVSLGYVAVRDKEL